MVHLKGKSVITLLLIITMVIQPVIFSYAMASMDHSHHGSVTVAHGHDGYHGMDEKSMMDSQQQNDHDDGNVLDNCCHTAACSPAVVMGISPTSDNMHYVFSFPQSFSFEGIDLPTEIKPPRSLLG